jgi:hypothetical protein
MKATTGLGADGLIWKQRVHCVQKRFPKRISPFISAFDTKDCAERKEGWLKHAECMTENAQKLMYMLGVFRREVRGNRFAIGNRIVRSPTANQSPKSSMC